MSGLSLCTLEEDVEDRVGTVSSNDIRLGVTSGPGDRDGILSNDRLDAATGWSRSRARRLLADSTVSSARLLLEDDEEDWISKSELVPGL